MFLARGFKASKLTTSILKHLRPFKEKQVLISEEILKASVNPAMSARLRDLQIELAGIEGFSKLIDSFDETLASIRDLEELKNDKDMAEEAKDEYLAKVEVLEELESQAIDLLLDKDPDDESNVIIEIKPGVGGSESSLFSEDLLNMYINFANLKNWKTSILERSEDQQINRGVKEAMLKIEGSSVYSYLKYESGVHKVIRVPQTEKSGRLHSSTACVVVLPDKPPDDFVINEKDIKIDVMRARGPGGQHVNKTESAVRATHIPTGITAQCQETRSQLHNRIIALEVLYARVYDHDKQIKMTEKAKIKKELKGNGDRNEKIRTYNFPQDRITDHRFDFTAHGIDNMMKALTLHKFVEKAEDFNREQAVNRLISEN